MKNEILDYFGEGVRLVTSKTTRQPDVAARGLYTCTIGVEFRGNQQLAATQGTFPIAAPMQRVGITA